MSVGFDNSLSDQILTDLLRIIENDVVPGYMSLMWVAKTAGTLSNTLQSDSFNINGNIHIEAFISDVQFIALMGALSKHKSGFRRLVVTGFSITDDMGKALGEASRKITILDISYDKFVGHNAGMLFASSLVLGKNEKLHEIRIGDSVFPSEALVSIITNCNRLEVIRLVGIQGLDVAAVIAAAANLPDLEEFTCNGMGDANEAISEAFSKMRGKEFPKLQSLQLACNGITDNGAVAIAKKFPGFRMLTLLGLHGNDIAERGEYALSHAVSGMTFGGLDVSTLSLLSPRFTQEAGLFAYRHSQWASEQAKTNGQVFTILSAAPYGQPRPDTALVDFVRRDGDLSLAHRVLEFLLTKFTR